MPVRPFRSARGAALLGLAVAVGACGSQSPAGDSANAAVPAKSPAVNAAASALPFKQGIYANVEVESCARATSIFFYDGANYGEIGQAQPEVPRRQSATPAYADVYQIHSIGSPDPKSDKFDEHFAGFVRVWTTENADDLYDSLMGVKAAGPSGFIKREGGYGATGVYHGRDDSYQKCSFAQLSPQMQAAIRAERPQLAGEGTVQAEVVSAQNPGPIAFPPIEKGYYAINMSCAEAVADPYMTLTYIDEKRISSSDGHSEILGFEALGGQRYREHSRSRDASGKWNTSSSVITVKGRTSFSVEHSYESFGEKITDVIQHNYCPTTQIPRAERVGWGDLSRK